MSNVIRSLIVKVGADTSDFATKMKNVSKDLKKTGKSISDTGSKLTKGLTVPLVGAAAGLTGLAVKAGALGDDLMTTSAQLGITTDSLQKLQYASRFVDVEVETMAKGMAKTTKAMGAATAKGLDYVELADGLTVSTRNANGTLKDSEQMFYDTVDALGAIKDETQREITAQELFGKSYQDLMPLISAGAGALKEYGDEAEKMGLILSEEAVADMAAFDDKVQVMQAGVEAATAKVGLAFIPVLESLWPIVQEQIIPALQGFADKLTGLITWYTGLEPWQQKTITTLGLLAVSIGPVLTGVGGLITNVSGLVKTFGTFSTAMSSGKTIIGALGVAMGPGAPIVLGIMAVSGLVIALALNWDKVTAAIKKAWDWLTKWNSTKNSETYSFTGAGRYVNGSGFSSVDYHADGGIFTKPTLFTNGHLVGEAGAEAILPLAKLPGLLGLNGRGVTFNITGNHIASDYDVDRIGNQLVKKLKLAGVKV